VFKKRVYRGKEERAGNWKGVKNSEGAERDGNSITLQKLGEGWN